METSASRFISEEFRTAIAAAEARGEARGRAEAKAEAKAEGKAEGKAESLLVVLKARGVAVPEHSRSQFLACTDIAQLDEWLVRAATAGTISDVTGRPKQGRRWRGLRRTRT